METILTDVLCVTYHAFKQFEVNFNHDTANGREISVREMGVVPASPTKT